ncbi:hypothetical protein ABT316_03445 [Streptomyces cellulosae]
MDAAELDRQTRTQQDCVPPHLVTRLLERGHADVVEHWAGQGEWFCAREWARMLAAEGRQAEALDVLAPYLATGWWTASATTAGLLETWGRAEEAIELSRTRMERGHPLALEFHARLLARHGRADEAFTLLKPHIDDWSCAAALVDVVGDAGQDEEAAGLLAARVHDGHVCDSPWCCGRLDLDLATGLLARVRERQGRVDEAVALLRTRAVTSLDGRDQLADLLARHDRLDDLRAYAAADDLGDAVRSLAELLEARGDVEGAIAAYREADAGVPHTSVSLAELLARHGRGDEALEVIGRLAETYGGEDWILHALSELHLRLGRPEDGLARLDVLSAAREHPEDWSLFRTRLPLAAAAGRTDEAIARARAHPEGDTSYAARDIAELLAGAGRLEEAVEELRRHEGENVHELAGCLVGLGQVDEAVAVLHQDRHGPSEPTWDSAAWRAQTAH